MGRFAGVCDKLGVKSAAHAFVYGFACALVGALAASLAWRSLSEPSQSPRGIIGVGVNSNAGVTGEVAPEVDNTTLNRVPLHERSDYRVAPPDILTVKAGHIGPEPDEELLAVSGEKLVQPDGTLDLDEFGSVYVEGLTQCEIQSAIAARLHAENPDWQASVSVFKQNSKVYYIILEGGSGQGDQVLRYPVVGDETVLDALCQVERPNDLQNKRIWIARPQPGDDGVDAILPVQWKGSSDQMATCNNYQILPGDRIFIAEITWWEQLLERAAALRHAKGTGTKNDFPVEQTGFHSY